MCRPFVPKIVYVTEKALKYADTARIAGAFRQAGSEVVRGMPRLPRDLAPAARFARAKTIVVLTADERPFFRNCRPSADYELNFVRGCPGMCEYCYLQTTAGPSPYTRVYVNVEEILEQAGTLCRARNGLVTFEASSQGDPVPLERYTGALRRAIEFFARLPDGYLRLVTKFSDVEPLLGLDHRKKTRVRFSLEAPEFSREFERGVPSVEERLEAAAKVAQSGYPVGFLVAPVFLEGGLRPYEGLLRMIREVFAKGLPEGTTLEFVTHSFTQRARTLILTRCPESRLPMTEVGRRPRRGRFGTEKYVYPVERVREARETMLRMAAEILPEARVEYFV